jgi:hypothetical protein
MQLETVGIEPCVMDRGRMPSIMDARQGTTQFGLQFNLVNRCPAETNADGFGVTYQLPQDGPVKVGQDGSLSISEARPVGHPSHDGRQRENNNTE